LKNRRDFSAREHHQMDETTRFFSKRTPSNGWETDCRKREETESGFTIFLYSQEFFFFKTLHYRYTREMFNTRTLFSLCMLQILPQKHYLIFNAIFELVQKLQRM